MSLVEGLKSGIDQLFEDIGCNTAPVRALLGGAELTEDNMLSYLGIVEQRANELLQVRLDGSHICITLAVSLGIGQKPRSSANAKLFLNPQMSLNIGRKAVF